MWGFGPALQITGYKDHLAKGKIRLKIFAICTSEVCVQPIALGISDCRHVLSFLLNQVQNRARRVACFVISLAVISETC